MIGPNRSNIAFHAAVAISVLGLVLAQPSGFAKSASKPDPSRVQVVSHLALPGTPAREMLLQQQKGHEYLYMVRSSGRGFTVIDVTQPDHPTLVKKVDLPEGTTVNMEMVGTTIGLAEESNTARATQPHPESVELFDLSDPADPRPLRTFTGVTSVLAEDGRHLVYITNNDGLWILSRPATPTTHPCTSSDQISGMPECD
jgi:hypothetical protein